MKIEFCREFKGSPDPIWYFTRGHVGKRFFLDSLRAYLDSDEYKKKVIPDCRHYSDEIGNDRDRVKYLWWRFRPSPGGGGAYEEVSGRGRGNFPVTVYDVIEP